MTTDPAWRKKMRSCRLCHKLEPPPVYIDGQRRARPLFHEEGNLQASVLFVLEAPNWKDTFDPAKGRMTFGSWTDRTGALMERLLRQEVGLDVEDVMMVNSVLCLPALDKYRKYEVTPRLRDMCVSNLRIIIDRVDPHVVVTVGGKALAATGRIEKHHLALKEHVATPHEWFGRTIFPLYHASGLALIRRNEERQCEDYARLGGLLQRLT